MFSKFLVSCFMKDNNIENQEVREAYGYFGGIVGIVVNVILFIVKFFVGIITSSIAITADAFNNLSDVLSSVITIVGFKLANRPADKEHPFGHGRIEYISALIVSFLVLLVGLEFIKASFNRIIHPKPINFETLPFILILLSIGAKLWLSKFNNYIGKTINSSALMASSFDALSDVFSSSCVALSLFVSQWISFPIDGYIGIVVALFILYSGISIIKDTLNPLLGESPDPKLVQKIEKEVMKHEYITGVHDLIIHSYGPSKYMASIHAEVPDHIPITKIHEVIDKAEKEISITLNILLVIHMDPINTNNKEVANTKQEVKKILKDFPCIKSMHDFRMVGNSSYKNLIFDIVIGFDKKYNKKFQDNLKADINKRVKAIHPSYSAVITIDKDYLGSLR